MSPAPAAELHAPIKPLDARKALSPSPSELSRGIYSSALLSSRVHTDAHKNSHTSTGHTITGAREGNLASAGDLEKISYRAKQEEADAN